ncbi:hypothetical protein DFH07DRAFT_779546 [Mycena maculata]|uniref:Actin-like ATPase domain-containing protein n=1 Tax=Mycena maculata TaxID=230809 RepID=A0AAD7I916_9AGAR|nr:hypothetical protein DFH07DRAFT_779546 [Mycena maculata]
MIEAEENRLFKAEWWKLLLRPTHLLLIQGLKLPPLPANVTLDDVFTHHLGYVKDQVKAYITTTYGEPLGHLESHDVCYTYNAQRLGRQPAKENETGSHSSRAAVLYAAESGSVDDWLVADGQLILCDCGGGTVDITGYKIDATKPVLKLSESSAPRSCLQRTEWEKEESMQWMVSHFDKNTKKKFADEDMVSYVQLEGHKSNPALNVTRGRLKITGQVLNDDIKEMAAFFAGPLEKIIEGLEVAFENGDRLADASTLSLYAKPTLTASQKVFLVSGLASSPYVYSKLGEWASNLGISVSRPDGPTMKAVANGALAWHLDSSVRSRVAKCHYRVHILCPYIKGDPDCMERAAGKFQDMGGQWFIPNRWFCIVKNAKIEAGPEFAQSFVHKMNEKSDPN